MSMVAMLPLRVVVPTPQNTFRIRLSTTNSITTFYASKTIAMTKYKLEYYIVHCIIL